MFAAELNAHPLHDWLETDYRPFPRRQERDAWNALPESKRAQLLSWADEARQGYPMVTATQFLAFCRTGDRTAYEKPYFARRNRLMGAALGQILPWNLEGIDFCMTALFVVILMQQWEKTTDHFPALLGGGMALVCLTVLGPDRFMLPALLITSAILFVTRTGEVRAK